LGLPWSGRQDILLGDGTKQTFDLYRVVVLWDGQRRIVDADASDSLRLVGTAMLVGYDLFVRMVVGGAVTIEASP
jgi:predicted aspartyl protease